LCGLEVEGLKKCALVRRLAGVAEIGQPRTRTNP
jgi:hypothetical protein